MYTHTCTHTHTHMYMKCYVIIHIICEPRITRKNFTWTITRPIYSLKIILYVYTKVRRISRTYICKRNPNFQELRGDLILLDKVEKNPSVLFAWYSNVNVSTNHSKKKLGRQSPKKINTCNVLPQKTIYLNLEKEKVSMLEIDRERLELEKQIVAIADNYWAKYVEQLNN